jgi:SPP1 family phage portal protein
MANNVPRYSSFENGSFTGRKKILLDFDYVDSENIRDVLEKALQIHNLNRIRIEYLWNYYKGNQPVYNRIKEIREEINNKVCENRAFEIVSWKDGYFLEEPIQYVATGVDDNLDALNTLNDWMRDADKETADLELVNWLHICGVAYRITNSTKKEREPKEAPFYTYSLDPRDTFVVYSSRIVGNPPIMCCKYTVTEDGEAIYSCYTPTMYYELTGNGEIANAELNITKSEPNMLKALPIVEYIANPARLGVFETVLSLLDAINEVDSDRVDAVDQFVQAIMLFHNVDVDEDTLKMVKELGALAYADINDNRKGEVKYITAELNQSQTQTLIDHMYQAVLQIVGMPSQGDGNSSDSSNNGAVTMKNGWQSAETRAKAMGRLFKKSEKQFLKLVMTIADDMEPLDLSLSQIDVYFPRRNYDNIATKANVLSTLIDKIPPHSAYVASNLFVDTEAEYKEYERWAAEQKKTEAETVDVNPEESPDIQTQ